ncbi:glycosyltransferase [Paenibacillus sp. 481]|uniref:glycosyltransferase n=1 Tax=Paenibacillus sp. 481 TaxID=2835869 RepID=UPI001E4307E3|nr:glycosyltransferase [Paenibacillus sp. 481]UHA75034.1 glycosyltransferase [Paenibacillus sp. 481]
MSNPLLSVCLIVRDEEKMLPACLNSVKHIADEIVVVDTGSVDHSVDIAKQYGAKVLHHVWKNDFAAARNVGLEAATGSWILTLDADETLHCADAGLLRDTILQTEEHVEGLLLQVEHVVSNDVLAEPMNVNPILRLFRNRPAYRFEGQIHEQIAAAILRSQPQAALTFSRLRIRHYGYCPEIVHDKRKVDRNVTMLLDMLERTPHDPFHLFNLAVERIREGAHEKALNLLREARQHTPVTATFGPLIIKYEAWALAALGRYEEAANVCTEGQQWYEGYTDLYFSEAIAADAAGLRSRALQAMQRAIDIGIPESHYHTESGIGTYRAQQQLAIWAVESRLWNEACTAYTAALHADGCTEPIWLEASRLYTVLRCSCVQHAGSDTGNDTGNEAESTTFFTINIVSQSKLDQLQHALDKWTHSPQAERRRSAWPPSNSSSAYKSLTDSLTYMQAAERTLIRLQQLSPILNNAAIASRLSIPLLPLGLVVRSEIHNKTHTDRGSKVNIEAHSESETDNRAEKNVYST